MTTDEDRKRIADGWIKLARTRDPLLMRELLTEDVVWTLPGSSKMSGEAQGHDGILRRLEILSGYRVNIDFRYVLYGMEDVAVLLHNTGEENGRILDEHLITLLRLRDGKIYRAETLISDLPVLNAFFM